ncbi:MAG: septum site-determining protein MinC [Buchnera aphidicola (Pentalonia nigronervosa)]|jgi:septum site-determining protein MinC|uniref:Probable septum site-determining protein MinC n=1 Tax=Buchnera aphidicola (Pentalonia nigronervosa) TaxID=1309793 RepID=A0A7H1AZV6_9GAMM|nr:MAG: septum site-determining protein MinC [Buchnera aphidicola (Pentalonia nigronervosa)]
MHKTSIKFTSSDFTLLVLHLNNYNIDIINQSLYKKVQEYPQFFKRAPIIVDVSKLHCLDNWENIQKIILTHGFFILGVSGCKTADFKKNIIDSGLPVISEKIKIHKNCHVKSIYRTPVIFDKEDKDKKKIIGKTHIIDVPVRSGQKIYAKHSDLIIVNNVSAGAELVADGNIHIYGVVRGRVLAGANGDTTRKIFCTELFAELVSISGEYWLSDQIPTEFIGKSAQIYLKNKFLTINALH